MSSSAFMKAVRGFMEYMVFMQLVIGFFWSVFGSVMLQRYNDLQVSFFDSLFKPASILAICFGCFLISWSILGFIAAYSRHNKLLWLHNIGLIASLLTMGALLGISISFHMKIIEYQKDNTCTEHPQLVQLRSLSDLSESILCQPDRCQCLYRGDPISGSNRGIKNSSFNSGAIRIQSCKQFTSEEFSGYKETVQLMKTLEQTFQCSGACKINPYYLFTNVNLPPPTQDCVTIALKTMSSYSISFLVASSILTMMCLFSVIPSLILSCKSLNYEFYSPIEIEETEEKQRLQ